MKTLSRLWPHLFFHVVTAHFTDRFIGLLCPALKNAKGPDHALLPSTLSLDSYSVRLRHGVSP